MVPTAKPALSVVGHVYPLEGTAEGSARTRGCAVQRASVRSVRMLNIIRASVDAAVDVLCYGAGRGQQIL